MSTNSLAGLSLDAILGGGGPPKPAEPQHQPQPQQQPPPRPPGRRTLMDIIKGEEPSKERRSWKHFRETLLLKRATEAWSSAVSVPASDASRKGLVSRSGSRRVSFRSNSGEANRMVESMPISDPQFKRGRSGRNKIEVEEEDGADIRNSSDSGRLMSAREAVAAQEAAEKAKADAAKAEAAAVEESEEEEEEKKQPSMSLMDLMGGYGLEEEEEEKEDDEGDDAEADAGGIEHTCCVCMVRHKGAAFIPCGHTFCRLCSRELMVQRGNCPVCKNFILEILDIF